MTDAREPPRLSHLPRFNAGPRALPMTLPGSSLLPRRFSSIITVLGSLAGPDLPIGSCQGWDAPGQQGGAAVDQRPLTIGREQRRETRRSGSSAKNRVCVCVRAGEGEDVRGRVGACVGVGCVCGCVVYRILRVRGGKAGFRAVG